MCNDVSNGHDLMMSYGGLAFCIPYTRLLNEQNASKGAEIYGEQRIHSLGAAEIL